MDVTASYEYEQLAAHHGRNKPAMAQPSARNVAALYVYDPPLRLPHASMLLYSNFQGNVNKV